MKILDVQSIEPEGIKVISFPRFTDDRGFFTEIYKKSSFQANPKLSFLKDSEFVQSNVSFSKKGVVRGLHFQWNPFIDKLVRVQNGIMIDLFLDIRKGSPTAGKINAYYMPTHQDDIFNEWIWIPAGFAHGGVFLEDTLIEYYCTGEYNPSTEAGISPLSEDIDWSLCEEGLKQKIDSVLYNSPLMSDKDKAGYQFKQWMEKPEAANFTYPS